MICWSVFGSQNLPLTPRIYPLFNKCICATLPESTSPSQNIPPFSTTICDPPRMYPSLPKYTPLFNNYNIMRPSQNIPLLPRIYPPFATTIILCDPPRIYPSFPKYTPFSKILYVRPSQNLPPPPLSEYTPLSTTVCDNPRNYPSPQKKHPSFFTTIWPPSLSEYIPRPLSTIFQESTPQSLNMPPFLETTCNCERIHHSLSELKKYSGSEGQILGGSQSLIVLEKGVDSRRQG